MIPLTRERTAAAIDGNFHGSEPRDRVIDLMKRIRDKLANGDEPKLKFRSKWAATKPQLMAETHDKCAYCESHATVVTFGDVEHYRPKSIYWWLAYVYDNYLASCQVCNQSWKSNNFEHAGAKLPGPAITETSTNAQIAALALTAIPDPLDRTQVRAFEAAHKREKPLNINPYIDDPGKFFAWDVLPGTREVRLIPKPRARNARKVVEACERIYGLNRPRLVRRRYKKYEVYMASVLVVNDAGASAGLRNIHEQLIDSYADADSEYAGMIRFFESKRASGEELPIPFFL